MIHAPLLGIAALAVALGGACGKSADQPAPPAEAEAAQPAADTDKPAMLKAGPIGAAVGDAGATAAATGIEMVLFEPSAVDKDMPHKGKVIGGLRWRDAGGDNMLVQSRVDRDGGEDGLSVFLYANHFVRDPAGKVKLLREVKDRYENCEFDNMTRFLGDASEVTDLDDDGLGEVWFAYVADCTSDITPLTTKLLALENGDKYIIRGRIDSISGYPGEKKVDPSLTKGPAAFAAHADAQWTKLARVE